MTQTPPPSVRRARVVPFLVVVVCGSAGGEPPARPTEPVEAAAKIRAVLDAQVVAWNAGKLDEFMAGYWESDELSFISGAKAVTGWKATKERYQKEYQADGKEMGRLAFGELNVAVLGPDAAFVRGKWDLKLAKETVGGRFTLVFRKFPDGWKITHDHTSK